MESAGMASRSITICLSIGIPCVADMKTAGMQFLKVKGLGHPQQGCTWAWGANLCQMMWIKHSYAAIQLALRSK